MKICIDCGKKHNRCGRSVRCKKCAIKRAEALYRKRVKRYNKAKRVKQQPTYCIVCGEKIVNRGREAKYCKRCLRDHYKEYNRNAYVKRRNNRIEHIVAYTCADCGAVYPKNPVGMTSIYCEDCQLNHRKERARLYYLRVGWLLNERAHERLGTSGFKPHMCRTPDGAPDLEKELAQVQKEKEFQFKKRRRYFGVTEGDRIRGYYPADIYNPWRCSWSSFRY